MKGKIPAILISGFLESGKTSYLNQLFRRGDFAGEKLLVIQYEYGTEELDRSACQASELTVAEADTELSEAGAFLEESLSRCRPDRVLIELNGMWRLSEFLTCCSSRLKLDAIIMVINALTFERMFLNLRPYFSEQLRVATQIMVNRETADASAVINIASQYAKLATICCQTEGGSYREIVPPLRHSFPAEGRIRIEEEDFFLTYRDILLHPEIFEGREFSVCGELLSDYDGNWKVEQRFVVCCAEDMISAFYPCVFDIPEQPSHGAWRRVTGVLFYRYHKYYGKIGPVICVKNLEWAPEPFPEL